MPKSKNSSETTKNVSGRKANRDTSQRRGRRVDKPQAEKNKTKSKCSVSKVEVAPTDATDPKSLGPLSKVASSGAVACDSFGHANENDADKPVYHNRPARKIGEITQDIANRPVGFAVAETIRATSWFNQKGTVRQLIDLLSIFGCGGKDGLAITQGLLKSDRRLAEEMWKNYIAMFDHDCGDTVDDVVGAYKNLGLMALVWTTFSHMKTQSAVTHKALKQFLGEEPATGEALLEQVRRYFKERKRYKDYLIESMEDVEIDDADPNAVEYIIHHVPMPRVRSLVILDVPFDFVERNGQSHAQNCKDWSRRYIKFEQALDGVLIDYACSDPSRAMYTPRVAELTDAHEIVVVSGGVLEFEALDDQFPDDQKSTSHPVRIARKTHSTGATPIPQWVKTFIKLFGRRFKVTQWLMAHNPKGLRRRVNDRKVEHTCPHDDAHTKGAGVDGGFMAEDADPQLDKAFVLACRHDTCIQLSQKDKAYYLYALYLIFKIDTPADLLAHCGEVSDYERLMADTYWDQTKCVAKVETDIAEGLDGLDRSTPDADVERLVKLLAYRGKDFDAYCTSAVKRIADATKWGKGETERALMAEIKKNKSAQSAPVATGLREAEQMVDELNRTFAYVRWGADSRVAKFSEDPGRQIEFLKLPTFHDQLAPQQYFDPVTGESKPISRYWMKHSRRRSFDGVVFDPSEKPQSGVLNLWRGFSVAAKKGDWSRLRHHLYENVCHCNPLYFVWLLAWLADIIQDPAKKKGTAVVLAGLKGVGKTKVAEHFGALMRNNFLSISKGDQLFGRFNSHLAQALFIVLEEPFWAGDLKIESVLKDLITSPTQLVEPKGVDAKPVANHMRLLMCSNADWVIPATWDERRFFVLEVNDAHKEDHAYFAAIDDQMADGGLEAMMYDLQTFKQPQWVNLRQPPRTPWLDKQILEGFDIMNDWMLDIIQNGRIPADGQSTDLTGTELTEPQDSNGAHGNEGSEKPSLKDVNVVTVRQSLKGYYDKYRKGGRLPNGKKLDEFLAKVGVAKSRRTIKKKRAWMYAFPPVPKLKSNFEKHTGIKFGVDEKFIATHDVKHICKDERGAWCRYAKGEEPMPGSDEEDASIDDAA